MHCPHCTKNDGGPVFPSPAASVGHEVGMSLRDWFAGMALQYLQPGHDKWSEIATDAYDLADAMLEARKAQEE